MFIKILILILTIICCVYFYKKTYTFEYFTKLEAQTLLEKVTYLFQNKGITTWLDCGTLLGAIRQNDFISKDTDVDIAAFEDDYAKSLEIVNDLNLLNEHNMICKRKKGKGVHEKIISLQIIGSNTYIDIYFWKWKPKLDKIEFKSKKYNAPYNSEMYLEYLYGPEWRIPCSDGCHANSYKHKEGIKNSTYFKQNKLISNF